MSLHSDFEEAKKLADEMQKKHAEAAQAYGHTKHVLTHIQPFWEQLQQRAETVEALLPFVQSGHANVAAVAASMRTSSKKWGDISQDAQSVALSASYMGSSTSTAHSTFLNVTAEPVVYDPARLRLPSYLDKKNLADRFAKIDPALGKVCREIWESLYGTAADPERAALFMLRQTWDHFFWKLSPDDKVRGSKHWSKTSEAKPDLVTRAQRIAYAIDTHVVDPQKKLLLAAATDQMVLLYDELNRAHARGEFNREKAINSLTTIYAWLEQWADATNL